MAENNATRSVCPENILSNNTRKVLCLFYIKTRYHFFFHERGDNSSQKLSRGIEDNCMFNMFNPGALHNK